MVCRSSGSQVQTCVLGACRACSTGPLSLQSLAQSQSSDWWWSRCFKLFLCYMTKTCLLDHECHHWVSHCLLAFPQKRSFVPTGLHLVFPVDTITASQVILWNNSKPGYPFSMLPLEPHFVINHCLCASHAPHAWESTALWDFWESASRQLSVQVCLSVGGMERCSGEWGAGSGAYWWWLWGRNRSDIWQMDCRERELWAGSISNLRKSRMFMLTLLEPWFHL